MTMKTEETVTTMTVRKGSVKVGIGTVYQWGEDVTWMGGECRHEQVYV
jgi:hypothetical protein